MHTQQAHEAGDGGPGYGEGGQRRGVEVHHCDREAIRPGAEEADIAEWQEAGEPVDDVQALGQGEEHDEVEQQQLV